MFDENGEPKVVCHDTNATAVVNVEIGENRDSLDWEERDFSVFERSNARTSVEMPAFFFAHDPDEYHEYGERRIEAFLNIRNPAENPSVPQRHAHYILLAE